METQINTLVNCGNLFQCNNYKKNARLMSHPAVHLMLERLSPTLHYVARIDSIVAWELEVPVANHFCTEMYCGGIALQTALN